MTNAKDLTKQAPRSPKELLGGYAILARTLDKCRATEAGTVGEYHFDCPVDNQLFSFKGITGAEFKAAAAGKSDDEVVAWLGAAGAPKTAEEVAAWSAEVIAANPTHGASPETAAWFKGECERLGLDPETTTLFDYLEKDDAAWTASC